jgi:hypothetical protein
MQIDPSESTACPACGDPFACGAGRPSCWCGSVGLSAEARARAAAVYRGCLCPGCLRLLAAGRLAGEGGVQPSPASSAPDAVAESTWS